jgi:diguanylate cyclase (GGDEF)-like protein
MQCTTYVHPALCLVIVAAPRSEPEVMTSVDTPGVASATPSSWLCRGDFDRQRMLEMEERIRPVRRRAAAIMALAILAAGPWLGWWPLGFVVSIMGGFAAADALMPKLARPELLMFGAWIASALTIALAVALSGAAGTGALPLLAIPVLTLSSRFSTRGVIVGVLISVALAFAVGFGVDARTVLADPVLLIMPVALILCASVLSTPLMQSDIKHRGDAVIDQLTGMLNRHALSLRVQELTEQASVTGEPIGLIVGDVDRFKVVNDTFGHTAGDAVLKDVAYTLRKQLRAFDLAYRLGGEEFLVLLPGAELESAEELAERLREAVCGGPLGPGVSVTMSFGVCASARGEQFDYTSIFARADAALYDAKRAGRDRVRVAGDVRHAVLA